MKRYLHVILALLATGAAMNANSNGHGTDSVLFPPEPFRFSELESRAINPENPTGEKGVACKDKGNGNCRKGAPAFRNVEPGEVKTLCDIKGSGMVRHIWMTIEERNPEMMRSCILRVYWDDCKYPSVECPIGDFFGVSHGRTAAFMTPYVGMPEGRSFHCYFPMPFSKRCRMTFENDSPHHMNWLWYQVDYTLGDKVTPDMGRFHANFRRQNPCPIDKDYVILDTQGSPGVFIGAVVGINPKAPGWWGEGEIKFYIDGDGKYPTICGTGTEDYLCSGWGMGPHHAIYTGVPYMFYDQKSGMHRLISFYRFHIKDPIYFQKDLRVELQQIGAFMSPDRSRWEEEKKDHGWVGPHVHPGMSDWLCDRSDDYSSVAYWYQNVTGKPLPPLPDRAARIADITTKYEGEN